MKQILFFLCLTLSSQLYGQSSKVVSAQCGKCHKPVSTSAKVGDYCPHCGVRWGFENTTSTSIIIPSTSGRTTENQADKATNKKIIQKPVVSNASKSETEEWLLSKLNAYCNEWDDCFKNTSFFPYETSCYKYIASYSFNSLGLVIRLKQVSLLKRTDVKRDETITLPIYDFKDLYNAGIKLHLHTNNSTVTTKKENGEQEVSTFEIIGFKSNAETDLDVRMERAFNHLKRFYTKPKSVEPF